jgi:ATP-binding protein involved in chromosome partitioning
MPIDEKTVLAALSEVVYPGFSRDVVSLEVVRRVRIDGSTVHLELALPSGDAARSERIESELRQAVGRLDGVVNVELHGAGGGSPSLRVIPPKAGSSTAAAGGLDAGLIPDVRQTIAVASGKGGVGKSTVAVNLAVALARGGARVGLLDADIYGPSIPLMMGLRDARPSLDPATQRLIPFERYGVRLMSLGFLIEPGTAVIWRGPMVMKAIEQLLGEVVWGELDVLVVDMPPGTGDAQLTLSQRVQLAGSVIVTTPQDVALADAIKGVMMFRKVGVPVLGIVENMSYFRCPHCSERTEVFGHGGGREEAERLGVPFLGEVPLDAAIRSSGDSGEPVAQASVDSPVGSAFQQIASRVLECLAPRPVPGAPEGEGGLFDRFRKVWGGPGHDEPED